MTIEKQWAYPAAAILVVGLLGTSLARMGSLERRLERLQSVLEAVGKDASQARQQVVGIATSLQAESGMIADDPGTEQEHRSATMAEVESLVKKLGESPKAEALAGTLVGIDEWSIQPGQEETFTKFKLGQQARLRKLIRDEVASRQVAALAAPTGADGMREHAEAGRILVMYPMSDEPPVIEEAKRLAGRQAEIPVRLEVIRRQRYNRWATDRIEKALDFYNANVSKWNPFADNAVLIGALVENLGGIDPATLEPAVLELYNYVIDRTKGSISEKNKLELAKRLTDPSIRRKALGDF